MKALACGLLFLTLGGCATAPKVQMSWMRIDGQRQKGNPALTQELQINHIACLGDRQKATLSGVTLSSSSFMAEIAAAQRSESADAVLIGCMADRGYLWVPVENVEAQLAAAAEVYAQRQKLQKDAEAKRTAGRIGSR